MQLRVCSLTGQYFTITDLEESFCAEQGIPLPTIAPLERLRRVCAFLSSIFLYPTKCALTGKDILTFIPPHKGLVVYDIDAWMSDDWDPLSFGQEYDSSRSFFEQMDELLKKAPLPSLECIRSTMENSDYTNGVLNVKNCYLSFGVINGEDVLFSRTVIDSKDIIDSVYTTNCELCFGCIQANNCYNVRYGENCSNCSDSSFVYDCHNCKHCYGSSNLNNKEYYFRNEPLSKEAYEERLATIDLGSSATLDTERAMFIELKKNAAVRFIQGKSNENADGNYLNHTKNCHNSLFASDAENIEWSIQMIYQTRNAFVCDGFGHNGENLYYSSAIGDNAYNIKFCYDCYTNIRDLEYCMFVGFGSTDCFGCVGLKRKQYCILNKQYSKEEYMALMATIKEQMLKDGEYGQFFPAEMAPMDYNRSEAQVFIPTSKKNAEKLGFAWKEDLVEPFEQTYQIPDNIINVKDDILDAILKCTVTGKKYKIIKQELQAYRRMGIPIPTVSPIARLEKIQSSLTVQEAKIQHCTQCKKTIMTVYDPKMVKVLCETCYQSINN